MNQKKVLTIQDISCVGRCSLTVALPIISAAGIETSILPTAVLSTHTGGFTGYTYRDLTEDIAPITAHWKDLHLSFDAIYTGYLGSFEQLRLVSDIFDTFKTNDNFIVVDPAMADNGKLYGGFSKEFPKGMAGLCAKADIIVPNLTEAAFLLGEEYRETYDKGYIEGLLEKLRGFGCESIVLTGVSLEPDKLGVATYDDGEVSYYFSDRIDGYYHGTGDIYASALVAAKLVRGSLKEAAEVAVDYTVACINATLGSDRDRKYGVDFEGCLPAFIKRLGLLK